MTPIEAMKTLGRKIKKDRLCREIEIWLCAAGMTAASFSASAAGTGTAPVIPDASHGKDPLVTEAANGINVVNIRTPDKNGLSHNQYKDLQVGGKGLIFNNSGSNTKTELAGYIKGNVYMKGTYADIILNEVTGTKKSSLNGFMEVAGHKADLIIANPNGIIAGNTGFINTGRAVLAAGRPLFRKGELNGFRTAGDVTIEGKGADFRGADAAYILAETVKLNGEAAAKEITIVTGDNSITKAGVRPENIRTGVGLDVAAIGGMYADKIFLIGTEKGLGVNNEGTISVANGGLTVSAEGKLRNAGTIYTGSSADIQTGGVEQTETGVMAAGKNLTLASTGDIQNGNRILAEGNVSLTAAGSIENEGTSIEAGKHLTVRAGKDIHTAQGTIQAGQNLGIYARGTLTYTGGTIEAGQDAEISAETVTTGGTMQSHGNMELSVQSDFHHTGTMEAGKALRIAGTGRIINDSRISGGDSLAMEGVSVTNTAGGTLTAGTISMEAGEEIFNRGLINGGDLSIKSRILTNRDTGRIYGTHIAVSTGTMENLAEQGGAAPVMAARESLAIGAETVTNAEHALLRAEGDLTMGGTLDEKGNVQGRTKTITNRSGYMEAGRNGTVSAETIRNENAHFSSENVLVSKTHYEEAVGQGVTERFTLGNKGTEGTAYIQREGHVDHLYTPDGGNYDHFNVYKYDRYIYEDRVKTTDPAHILAGGHLSIEGDTVVNDKSRITAGGTLSIKASDLQNRDAKGTHTVRDIGQAINYYTKKVHHGVSTHRRTETRTSTADYRPADAVTEITVLAAVSAAHTAPKGTGAAVPGYEPSGGTHPIEVPDSSLYKVTEAPEAKYIVETDPAYADKKQWLSSDYFYEAMQQDPDHVSKRLGDGYYEQQIIRDQVMTLTGKRFLGGYGSDEEEYKALMDNALSLMKENQDVKVGVALTEAQQKALKQDVVWMVETAVLLPDGQIVKALVPQIYLAEDSQEQAVTGPAVISANDVDFKVTNDILNEGTIIAGDKAAISADNINNIGGTIQGSDAALNAVKDIYSTGTFLADKSLTAKAGRDLTLTGMARTETNGQGSTTSLSGSALAAVNGNEGKLTLAAGRDMTIRASTAAGTGKNGSVTIEAGRNANLDTVQTGYSETVTWDGSNKRSESMTTDNGSAVSAEGNLTIRAGQDVHAKAASIAAGKALTVQAGNDIRIEEGKQTADLTEDHKHKSHGFLSSTIEITHDEVHQAASIGSVVQGKTVSMESGRDTTAKGSAILGEGDVTIQAGGNAHITASEDTVQELHQKEVKKSGLLGGGLGFTIGKEQKKARYDEDNTIQKGSVTGSAKGSVRMTAKDDIHAEASAISAGKNAVMEGKNVTITSKDNVYNSAESHEYKKSGLSVSLGGGVVDVLGEAAGQVHRGSQVRDNTLKALYGYEGYNTVKEGLADYKNNPASMKPVVQVGFGSSHYQDTSSIHAVKAVGSQVTAGETISIHSKDNLTVKGSGVAGKDVTLEAGKNLSLTSSANTTVSQTNTSGKSSGVGMSLSASGTGIYANASAHKGKEQEETISHTESVVSASDHLTMKSGKDTVIHGGKAEGKKVTIQTGGNLSIASEKDSDSYREKTSSKGGSIQMGGSYTAQAGKTNTDSRYESVTDQSGIYAGSEGYDANVKGNTDLKGAVIDSKAPAEKNHLTTGTLTWEDIQNEADYKAGGYGVGYSKGGNTKLNEKGLTPNITPTVKDKAESTTKAGISEGTITITDKDNRKQDVTKLNRDTKNSLNTLAQIFDKEDVKERQELIGILSKEGNKAIHKLAESKGWEEGSTEKVLAHGALGAILGDLSGGSALTGAMTGGVSEYVTGYLEKTKGKAWMEEHPDAVQNITAVVGGALGSLAGEAESGAYNGQSGAKWNFLGFEIGTKDLLQNDLKKADGSTLTDKEAQDLAFAVEDIAEATDPYGANTDQLEKGDSDVQKAVRQYLEEQGFGKEGIDQYLQEYNDRIEVYQDEMKSGTGGIMKAVEVFGNAVENASDSSYVKHTIGAFNYISDMTDIVTSKYPGNTAFGVVSGSIYGALAVNVIMIGGMPFGYDNGFFRGIAGIGGGYIAVQVTDKVNNKLEKETVKQGHDSSPKKDSGWEEK